MISLPFVIVAALCKAIMDKIQFHFNESVFKDSNRYFFDPELSWVNKYKNHSPSQGPKFFGSTTIFVMFTDAWHLFGSIQRLMWILAIVLYKPTIAWWADGMILMASHMIVFHVLFTYAFMRKAK